MNENMDTLLDKEQFDSLGLKTSGQRFATAFIYKKGDDIVLVDVIKDHYKPTHYGRDTAGIQSVVTITPNNIDWWREKYHD